MNKGSEKLLTDYHEPRCTLPRPRPRLLSGDGEYLSIILVDTDEQ